MSRLASVLNARRAVMIKLELLLVAATIFLLSHIAEASSRSGFGISGHLHSNDAKHIALVEINISVHSSDLTELSESRSVKLTEEVTGEQAQNRARLAHPSAKVAGCLKNAPVADDVTPTEVTAGDDPKPPTPTGVTDGDDPRRPTPTGVTDGASQTESPISLFLQQSWIRTLRLLRSIY